MKYDVLREFACRDNAEPIRLNAYVTYDHDRAVNDERYKERQQGFFSLLRDFGFKVIEKRVKWYTDEDGNRYGKANADLDLAVDAILQSEKLNRVILATGDGDFVQVVRALQNKGCRVEIIAFDNVSEDLRREADMFMSGYLIPDLLPSKNQRSGKWGEIGSWARGVCNSHPSDHDYGFMKYMKVIGPDSWKTNIRLAESLYGRAHFRDSDFRGSINIARLPSRNLIFEFDIKKTAREGDNPKAVNIDLVSQF